MRYVFLFLLIINIAKAQQVKPIQGKIEFAIKENPYTSLPVISLGDTLPRVTSQKYVFEFKNDSIIEFYKIMSTEKVLENRSRSTFINTNKHTFHSSTDVSQENLVSSKVFDLFNSDNTKVRLDIKKFPNEKQVFLGYNCYRVEIEELKKLDSLTTEKTKYDLYVTEDIKCEYHPILKHKSFLRDFYPLEIISRKKLVIDKETLTEKDKELKILYEEVLFKSHKSVVNFISIF